MDRKRKAIDEVEVLEVSAEMEEYNSSEDLFPDVEDTHASTQIETADKSASADGEMRSYAGVSLASMANYTRFSAPSVSSRTSVFVEWPRDGCAFRPHPAASRARDSWDDRHVRMPFSKESVFPVSEAGARKTLQYRWSLITEALDVEKITSSNAMEAAIMKYNVAGRMDFSGLHHYFEETVAEEEADAFFSHILPDIVRSCLALPDLVTQPIPLLKKRDNRSITLSQKQIASLLANAFFCTFPRRTLPSGNRRAASSHEYASYPSINFNRLFATENEEKFKCLINYFRKISAKREENEGLVTFQRRCIPYESLPKWDKCQDTLTARLHIDAKGTIEDEGYGLLQVDFANAFVGGGVLGRGCVQEEIRFLISPELIVSRLFTERLGDNECLVITGFERFSRYSGYASTFHFSGHFDDQTPVDPGSCHRLVRMVAIDALRMKQGSPDQYSQALLARELNKAYVGFERSAGEKEGADPTAAVATGNWGCGAFGGDPRLKALIQLMAASAAGRDVAYFTFGDARLRDDVARMHGFLVERQVKIGALVHIIGDFAKKRAAMGSDLYEHIENSVLSFEMADVENRSTDFTVRRADAGASASDVEIVDAEKEMESVKKSLTVEIMNKAEHAHLELEKEKVAETSEAEKKEKVDGSLEISEVPGGLGIVDSASEKSTPALPTSSSKVKKQPNIKEFFKPL